MTQDRAQRLRAIQETDKSFVVEASAGTGKTSILLDRILHLVVNSGPEGDPIPLSRICAITFTEKAAGEMKVRLRQNLEVAAAAPGALGKKAQEALKDLETASISTFHAFAVSLLKERPIEAGLDPRFEALDDLQAELLFREIWEPWLGRALAARDPRLEKALRSGLRMDTLQDLGRTLRLHLHEVRELRLPSPLSEAEVNRKISGLLERGRPLYGRLKDNTDRLARYLEKALAWLECGAQGSEAPGKPGSVGAASNWNGGKETVLCVREFVREVVEFGVFCRRLPAQRILVALVEWMIEDFLPEWASAKRIRGVLDFDDQLRMARELLIKSRSARAEFQRRYTTLLVDEFQDTDRTQLDLVLLLSSTDLEETEPARLRPDPGRLFIVGDPKQSIYRFRSADIETYLEIVEPRKRATLGLERLQLTANFRSASPILRFVDSVFGDLMKVPEDGGYQPDYLPFGIAGMRNFQSPRPSVGLLGDREGMDGGRQPVRDYSGREASRIAKMICKIVSEERWMLADPRTQEMRRARFGDIAVLMPVLTHADILEEKLREADVPYVLEGGKYYYARNEVSSAITVLRSVANPNDVVALYGALRSIFFGLSDEDLVRASMRNLPLDYRKDIPQDSPLYHSFAILRELHRLRHQRPASETFESLLARTGAREVLAARGFQTLANLGKLVRRLRSLQRGATFSQVIDLMASLDEERMAETESRLMEERSDAVRVLSIHRAKGLDFPVVFLAGLGFKKMNTSSTFLADPHGTSTFAIRAGSEDSGLQTPDWTTLAAANKKREDAELIRLLYVAMTRARDHLVVCLHTAEWREVPETGLQVPCGEGTRLKPLMPALIRCLSGEESQIHWMDVQALDKAEIKVGKEIPRGSVNWSGAFRSEQDELMRLLEETPFSQETRTGADHKSEKLLGMEAATEEAAPAARTRAVRLGIAFHEVMEKADWFQPDSISDIVKSAAVRQKLDDGNVRTLESMIEQSLRSDVLERARAAVRAGGEILRELTFIRPVFGAKGTIMEEGKIDLLYRESEGWVLVDYKTDQVPAGGEEITRSFQKKYEDQIQAYALALGILGIKLKAAYLLMARTGRTIEMRPAAAIPR